MNSEIKKEKWNKVDILRCILAICIISIAVIYVFDNDMIFIFGDKNIEFEGNGTKDNPYLIKSAKDLKRFSDLVNEGSQFDGCYFQQTCDINLRKYDNWKPIGVFDGDYMFNGVYNGAGKVVYNLNIDGSKLSSGNVGLFGKLGEWFVI